MNLNNIELIISEMSTRTKRDAFFSTNKDLSEDSVSGSHSFLSRRPLTGASSVVSDFKLDTNGYSGSSITLASASDDISSMVGYSNLPNQIHRNAIRRGFDFNLMIVGASGLGKSTFVNSLFLSEIYNSNNPGPSKRTGKTLCTEASCFLLKENSVELRLTVVDTPGFGDAVDNTNCWKPVIDYIETRFDEHMRNEQRVHRPLDARDDRVHACLYFIQPTGHGLKALDLEFLRQIHEKVNVIPIIAKADTLTTEECQAFKRNIHNELLQAKIRTYDFPEKEFCLKEDENEKNKNKRLRERQPFAVVGSNCLIPSPNGRGSRGRTYPWGTVEVDNLDHNDFLALRSLMLTVHMEDLIETTEQVLYEAHRQRRLSNIAEKGNFAKDPLAQLEEERVTFENKIRRSEAEMEQVFESKVREKIGKLKELEASNQRRAEQMQKQLQAEEIELENRWKAFQLEKQTWEATSGAGGDSSPHSSVNPLNVGGGVTATLPASVPDKKPKKGRLF